MKKTVCVIVMIAALCALSIASGESLVVYFSCTGTTENVASMIADAAGADLYRLLPSVPYTEADLAYYTDCRADREQKDDSARPAISNMPTGLDRYDTIYIGYPIWHGQAPKIMYTFAENASLSGKKIIPFCTSHSSGVGTSAENLKKADGGANTWTSGRRFSKDTGMEDVVEWLLEAGTVRIKITVGEEEKTAVLEHNTSAAAFYGLLDLSVNMEDYGGFEKVGPLGTKIEQNDSQITTVPGDIILYQGDKVTVYYAENTYQFTKLGHIEGATGENMKAFLGEGAPKVSFAKMKGNKLASVINCSSHLLEPHEGVEATCEEEGTEAYWSCSVCGKLFSDAKGEKEISEPVSIDKAEHEWDEGKVTKEATAFENGITVYTCKNCGAMKEETPAYQISLGKSGWVLNSDGSWSYGDAEWNALFGPQAIDGILYCFNGQGKMITGWEAVNGIWYCADENGTIQTGWIQYGDTWYLLKETGEMAVGWAEYKGTWYYFHPSGRMAADEWIADQADGKTIYYRADENGACVTGWAEIDGRWEFFDESGVWLYTWAGE